MSKLHLTDNGKAVATATPIVFLVAEVAARGGGLGFAAAAITALVGARHGGDIKNAVVRVWDNLVSHDNYMPSDEEIDAYMRAHTEIESPSEVQQSVPPDQAYKPVEDAPFTLSAEEREDLTFCTQTIRVFSELLETGWRPTANQIYVGTTDRGKHLFVPAKKLCHVALSGATGHGKSSLLRLIMVQLCYLKLSCVLFNPHYMIFDLDHNEDWTPYTPYLHKDPMACKQKKNIAEGVKWAAEELLETRMERCANGGSAGAPFFIILDEYPDIKAEIPEIPQWVGKLLRQGRKYNIFLIVASQDFSVKTMGMEGEGSVRKCFLTTFYVGGDPITARELLNKSIKDIPENRLGQGNVLLKSAMNEEPVVVHVPYLDNKSLYMLLGQTTFNKPGTLPHDDFAFPVSDSGETGNHDSGNRMETSPQVRSRRNTDELEMAETVPTENEGNTFSGTKIARPEVSEETLNNIRRMKKVRPRMNDGDIATCVGLAGRKYGIYRQAVQWIKQETR